jgi:hypothetical protein
MRKARQGRAVPDEVGDTGLEPVTSRVSRTAFCPKSAAESGALPAPLRPYAPTTQTNTSLSRPRACSEELFRLHKDHGTYPMSRM